MKVLAVALVLAAVVPQVAGFGVFGGMVQGMLGGDKKGHKNATKPAGNTGDCAAVKLTAVVGQCMANPMDICSGPCGAFMAKYGKECEGKNAMLETFYKSFELACVGVKAVGQAAGMAGQAAGMAGKAAAMVPGGIGGLAGHLTNTTNVSSILDHPLLQGHDTHNMDNHCDLMSFLSQCRLLLPQMKLAEPNYKSLCKTTCVSFIASRKCALSGIKGLPTGAQNPAETKAGLSKFLMECEAINIQPSRPITAGPKCTDHTFYSKYGNCATYAKNNWCTKAGKAGTGWQSTWGKVSVKAVAACCACGGGAETIDFTRPTGKGGRPGKGKGKGHQCNTPTAKACADRCGNCMPCADRTILFTPAGLGVKTLDGKSCMTCVSCMQCAAYAGCGAAAPPSANTPTAGTQACVDDDAAVASAARRMGITSCAQAKGMGGCTNPMYSALLASHCPLSCGACATADAQN